MRFGKKHFEPFAVADPFKHSDYCLKAGGGTVIGGGCVLGSIEMGGICGALLTNLSAWLSGTWFDLELLGGVFKEIAFALPFVHAVELERAVLSGSYANIGIHFLWVACYTLVALFSAVFFFIRQMKKY